MISSCSTVASRAEVARFLLSGGLVAMETSLVLLEQEAWNRVLDFPRFKSVPFLGSCAFSKAFRLSFEELHAPHGGEPLGEDGRRLGPALLEDEYGHLCGPVDGVGLQPVASPKAFAC